MGRTAAVSILIVLAIAGCGGRTGPPIDQPTADGARAAVQAFYDDILAGKSKAACALVTASARQLLIRGGRRRNSSSLVLCAGILDQLRQQLNRRHITAKFESFVDHVKVSVHGETATAHFGGSGTSTLVFSGGSWHISAGG